MQGFNDVDRMSDIIAMLRQVQNSGYVAEADEEMAADATDGESTSDTPQPGSVDQEKVDTDIEKLMTTPKQADVQDDALETLASDMGMDNPGAFRAAFELLRGGSTVDDPVLVGQLANAFVRLMVADAGTTQKVVNRLRREYKSASTS